MARIEPNEPTGVRQKQPRQTEARHLDAIRALPCLTCGRRPAEAAHIRAGSRRYGKRDTGMSEKCSDKFCLPLCSDCHRTGPMAQHSTNELEFYRRHRIDPFATALALWAASGDMQMMEQIVREATSAFGALTSTSLAVFRRD